MMNPSKIEQRKARQTRLDAKRHVFAVGQAVRFKRGLGMPTKPTDLFHITAVLPTNGVEPQYRIRNDEERHERATTQDSLESVDEPRFAAGATLVERTFGHGQGTETQQSRSQKAETGQGAVQA